MEIGLLALGIGGSLGVLGGAFALGLRHGIDWDHIAAITDITSTTTSSTGPHEEWLTDEPGVLLTDESDHVAAALTRPRHDGDRARPARHPRLRVPAVVDRPADGAHRGRDAGHARRLPLLLALRLLPREGRVPAAQPLDAHLRGGAQ